MYKYPQDYNKKINAKIDITLNYLYFIDKDHPLADIYGKVYLHRHIASIKLERWLNTDECVHHIDGNKANNNFDNLAIVTSSEHFTIHHALKGEVSVIHKCLICGKETKNKKYCSYNCSILASRKVTRPSKEQLEKEIKENSWCALGRKYGVTDNAVRKWAKRYDIV